MNELQQITALVLDTETTGVGANDQIISIGYHQLQDLEVYNSRIALFQYLQSVEDSKRINSFSEMYCPSVPIHPEATKVHGWTAEALAEYSHPSTFQFPAVQYMIGHNVDFDHRMLGRPDVRCICTMKLAKMLWKKRTDALGVGVTSYKLTSLIEELLSEGKDILDEAHSALGDATLTLILLSLILKQLPRVSSWEELWQMQLPASKAPAAAKPAKAAKAAKLPETMPYGKYINQAWGSIPQDYLEFILREHDLRKPLRDAIEQAIRVGDYAPASPRR